jgi:hypothetical protein
MSVTLEDVGFDDVTDPVVKKALEDALKAAASVTGGRRRGAGKNSRKAPAGDGGPPSPLAAARAVSGDAVNNPSGLAEKVSTAIKAVTGTAAVGAVGLVAVNRPDMLAQLAEVIAVSLSEIANLAVMSTYSDWGKAIVSIGRGIGVISQTGALQAGQGPVVPFAIATAIMTWRARANKKKDLFAQIQADAEGATTAVKSAASAVASAAAKAVRPDPMAALFEITERARQIKPPGGAGADELKALVKRELGGEPAVESGAAAGLSAVVPASRGPPRDPGAPLKAIAALAAPPRMGEVTRRGTAAITAEARARADLARRFPGSATGETLDDEEMAAPASAVLPPGPKPGDKRGREDNGAGTGLKKPRSLGGRRMTKKSKPKRRVTRRKAPSVVKFVY